MMSLSRAVCLLSLLSVAFAGDLAFEESTQKVVDECTAEKNVTEEDVHQFARKEKEATPEIKEFFLCMTQKLKTFDGISWNMDEIKRVVNDPNKMKDVEDCLRKDDRSLEPRERNFIVVACCLEKEAFV